MEVDEGKTVLELKVDMKQHIHRNIKMEIVRVEEDKGHEVLFTPPYHSDIQTIEMVWALVKGNVGRQYSTSTTLDIVFTRLMKEFDVLGRTGNDVIAKMIDSCSELSLWMYNDMDCDYLYDDDDRFCYDDLSVLVDDDSTITDFDCSIVDELTDATSEVSVIAL